MKPTRISLLKSHILCLTTCVLLLNTTYAQTIRRVNADATVTGINVYQTLQAAHDAATAGDVLIVEPGASVGNLTCTKTLTIYGRGYFLDKDPNYAAMPNNSNATTVGTITINASNVKVSGLSSSVVTINGGVSGIVISRNNIYSAFVTPIQLIGGVSAPISNISISQNYIASGNAGGISINGNASGIISNVNITNNCFSGNLTTSVGVANSNCSGLLVNQNTLVALSSFSVNYNTVFTNNIFLNDVAITNAILSNTIFSYNIFTSTSTYSASTGSNNILQANLSAQFASNTGGSADNNYRIVSSSPLKTAGSTGGEVGMFGGATPYVQYGKPAGPAVLKLINSGLGSATTPINATISAASNN